MNKKISKIYNNAKKYFGNLGWWPADSVFEIIIGAILTQNTSWKNVEKAIANLKEKRLIDPVKICKMRLTELSVVIRPAGCHNIKAKRLKEISRFIVAECAGVYSKLQKRSIGKLRGQLLNVSGVGPETADSILLYAFGKPVFVVDAYTKRVFYRHGLIQESAEYDEIQVLVHENFPRDTKSLNQLHALLVEIAKKFCKK
ncbi:MAG: hypothetical protein KJ983_05315, partial [Candidatus Omnitrophica bacterium]|nr:hypothetical protein [Candidatus Omnitrophota bacterium]